MMARLRRDSFIDLRPFRESSAFTRMWVGSTLAGLGGQLTVVAVMLHMFDLTGSTFAVAMIAVAGLLPMIVAGLYGGMLADAFDRRRVALIAASVTFASTLTLAVLAWGGLETVWWLYVLSIINSAANSIVMAARQAIVPRLLPRDLLPAASALSGITMGVTVMGGPALAGVLVAFTGYAWTYSVDVVLMLANFLGLWTLPAIRPEGEIVRPGLESLRDGWRFLKKATNIRLQFVLDITAMTFGYPTAIFPALGTVILGGGAITTGLLTASIAIGAFLSSVFSGRIGRVRRHGLGIERAIIAYGIAVSLFGLALLAGAAGAFAPGRVDEGHTNVAVLALAMLALVAAGAADNVSSIFRTTMLQAAVPDSIRGRLQGVFIVVVTGGPRLGALYAGALASLGALWLPPLLGGIVLICLVAFLVRLSPRFRAYDSLDPQP